MTSHPNRHHIKPPPSGSTAEDDRDEACVEALAPHIGRLAARATAAGWSEPEIACALLALSVSEMRAMSGDKAARDTLSAAIMMLDA